ncbi:DUF2635 domain-containing protein [Ancylobacter oerskovii]|uniref:DUF2635 domain-containing protein n=1 Tax=Ancylobacter oerskovii TaxID=459519 RepID=A0ABW4Z2R4_9HYPH|nr:DUF2635 domain-containing protein [Ancylobacter oerskovii]MBS7546244.1 DUF2635 domain-containing protein [Ancylobacter oerskovii]
MKSLFVKPAQPGLVVVHPDTMQTLPATGDWWPHDQFLMRRLPDSGDGSVVETDPPADPSKPAKAKE